MVFYFIFNFIFTACVYSVKIIGTRGVDLFVCESSFEIVFPLLLRWKPALVWCFAGFVKFLN